jgi:hypothetical protein
MEFKAFVMWVILLNIAKPRLGIIESYAWETFKGILYGG